MCFFDILFTRDLSTINHAVFEYNFWDQIGIESRNHWKLSSLEGKDLSARRMEKSAGSFDS